MPTKNNNDHIHDLAGRIVDKFDDLLVAKEIRVPSPEDDERDPDETGLYGSDYWGLFDYVENELRNLVFRELMDLITK